MTRDSLPEDLAEVEALLDGRALAAPPAAHRERILAAVGAELARARRPWWARADTWQFAAAIAAGAVLWLNLAMSAANGMRIGAAPRADGAAIAASARSIRRVLPDLPPEETLRQAVLARADVRLSAMPLPPWGPVAVPADKEVEPWGTP